MDPHLHEERIHHQRDTAVVCAALAAVFVLTMLLNNFGEDPPELGRIRKSVRQHREILLEHQKIIEAVTSEWQAREQEWAEVRRAAPDLP